MKYCSACGNGVLDTAVICPKCGSPLRSSGVPSEFPPWAELVGFMTAILLPIVGIGFGIWAIVKRRVGMGVIMIVISIICWLFWAALIGG
jgi:hypothetical protein